jgi:hypothetical protein
MLLFELKCLHYSQNQHEIEIPIEEDFYLQKNACIPNIIKKRVNAHLILILPIVEIQAGIHSHFYHFLLDQICICTCNLPLYHDICYHYNKDITFHTSLDLISDDRTH